MCSRNTDHSGTYGKTNNSRGARGAATRRCRTGSRTSAPTSSPWRPARLSASGRRASTARWVCLSVDRRVAFCSPSINHSRAARTWARTRAAWAPPGRRRRARRAAAFCFLCLPHPHDLTPNVAQDFLNNAAVPCADYVGIHVWPDNWGAKARSPRANTRGAKNPPALTSARTAGPVLYLGLHQRQAGRRGRRAAWQAVCA